MFDLLLSLNIKQYKKIGERPSELWQWLEGSLFKPPLGAWPYIGTQPCYKAPADLSLKLMIIYQFIYIWPTSFTEYATVEVTWRVMPSGLRLKISYSNTQGMTSSHPPPPHTHTHTHTHDKVWYLYLMKFISSLAGIYPTNFDFR